MNIISNAKVYDQILWKNLDLIKDMNELNDQGIKNHVMRPVKDNF